MIRELNQREAHGETVTLNWDSETDAVSVQVHRLLPDGCELVTATCDIAPENARDAFEHPYSYAHHCGSVTLPSRLSEYDESEEFSIEGYGAVSTVDPDNESEA